MNRKIITLVLTLVVLLAVWQVIEDGVNAQKIENGQTALEAFIPTPLTIAKTFHNNWLNIIRELSFTLGKAGLGFIIGVVFAMLIACIFSYLPFIRNLVFPLAFAINSFPIVGFAPVFILIFGQGSSLSIVLISALICYFPILISMDTAFRETDKNLLEFMEVLNASKRQILLKVRLPLAMPYLFLSMKLAIPASIIGATIGEWFGTKNGIGQLITIALYQLKPGLLYASLISITAVSTLCIFILSIAQYFLFPWKRNYDGEK
jgi:NitT/TauT family transport system permease protein